MARSDPQLNFRCPEELRERLDAAALAHGCSLTQEVVARLEASFVGDSQNADLRAALRRCENGAAVLQVLFEGMARALGRLASAGVEMDADAQTMTRLGDAFLRKNAVELHGILAAALPATSPEDAEQIKRDGEALARGEDIWSRRP